MPNIHEINVTLKVSSIYRKSLNKLINLADTDKKRSYKKFADSLDGNYVDVQAFMALYDSSVLDFSLYALAIVHCYSILENNRRLICQGISGITNDEYNNLHHIGVVGECLSRIGIGHDRIRCFKTMDEFRLVNNAIKHDRYGLSTSVKTKNGKKYGSKQLRSLYVNKSKHLETYLKDLYKRVGT